VGSQAPLGKQDLFKTPGVELPGYIREIARALMRNGKSKSQAIQIAIGTVKNWAEGKGGVNADTRAKAAKAVAEWEAAKAKARATPNKSDRRFSNDAGEQDAFPFDPNFLAHSGHAVLLARPADDGGSGKGGKTPPKKKPGQSANKEGLPKGAVGYKHGWIPVDASGKAVGPAQKPKWLADAEAKHKAAGGRTAEAIAAEKLKNEQESRARKAAEPARKAKAAKEKKEREAAAAKRKAETEAKRKKTAAERAAREKETASRKAAADRSALVNKAYKQALADQKAGRTLSDTQKRVIASVQAKQAKETAALRKVDVKGADASKAKLTPPAKKGAVPTPPENKKGEGKTVKTPAKKKATAAPKVSSKVRVKSYKARDRRTKTGLKRHAVTLSNDEPSTHGVNVLDFAGKNPAGQLAFRYKHGWILINPAIPTRGKMGGAIARKYGVKSGSVTHGHFVDAGGGKKKFVPTRHGGVNSPAKLKAAHMKDATGVKPDKSGFALVAAQKDTGGSALHPSTPTAEKVKATSKAANDASAKANSSKSLMDAQVAAKKHADAFVQAKKAGDDKLAASHKANAQAWAKKAQQIKQADAASAKAKAKYEAEQKAKAAEEKAKAEKAKAEAEKAAAEKKAKETKALNDAYKTAFEKPHTTTEEKEAKVKAWEDFVKLQDALGHDDTLTKAKVEQAHDQIAKLKDSIDAEKKLKANEKAGKVTAAGPKSPGKFYKAEMQIKVGDGAKTVEGMSTPSGKLLVHKSVGGKGYDVSGPSGLKLPGGPFKTQKEAKAYALWAEKNGPSKFTSDEFAKWKKDDPQGVLHFQAGIAKKEWNEDLAKAAAPKPEANAPETSGGVVPSPGDMASVYTDSLDMMPGNYGDWKTFMKASAAYKQNPTTANLKTMNAAAAALKKDGVTTKELQIANAALYKKLGISTGKTATAKPEAKKFTAEDFKVTLPGPGMYKDGNAINAAIKAMSEADAKGASGAEIDARLKAIENAKAAFKAKHGVEFAPTKVENIPGGTTPSAPFVPQGGDHISEHPFFGEAKKSGYSPVPNHASANDGWKPSDVPGLKSSKGAYTYSGGSYTAINAHLRPNTKGGTPGDPKAGQWAGTIAQMDKEFAAVPGLSKNIVTIRKMNDEGPFNAAPPYMTPGGVFVDDGYSSTAKDPAVWSGSVHMEVRIPAGTKVLDLNHTTGSQHSSEQEILLNRGTKYKVISDGPGHTAGVRKIVVEVVP
jgi:hypothetical protein